MNKILKIFFVLVYHLGFAQNENKIITRLGQVSFFSYTSVENIEASNNQVVSIIDLSEKKIAVSMLMRAFVFKKALMEEHFNESYVESDIYPKLQFQGVIQDFDTDDLAIQTRIVKGTLDFHGIKKEVEIKTRIENKDGMYQLTGDLEIGILDYDIKVPPLLAPNIAKRIKIMFRFEYDLYEKK